MRQQLGETLAQLREVDRLKDDMMRNVSHELRTPLALILGYTELLASGSLGELSGVQQEAINVAARRANETGGTGIECFQILEKTAPKNRAPFSRVQPLPL